MSKAIIEPRRWTENEREEAMLLYVTTDKSIKDVSKETGIPEPTLSSWSRKYKWRTYKMNSLDKFEALLLVTSERVASFEALGAEIKKLWYEAEDMKEKEQVVNMILKVDKRVAEWMGIANGIE